MSKRLSFKEQISITEAGGIYEEASGIFGFDLTEEEASLVLIPVPWDATASYKQGTAKAPEAIREASYQIDHHDLAFDRPYAQGIKLLDADQRIEGLNHIAHELKKHESPEKLNPLSAQVNELVEEKSREILEKNKIPAVIGGEHSCPYGLIKALSKAHEDFGILHVDAHFDLRKAFEGYEHSHASIMHNVLRDISEVTKIVSFGIRDFCLQEHQDSEQLVKEGRALVFYDRDIYRQKLLENGFASLVQQAIKALPEKVYISFDIDGLETQFCPSTGTPVPGGLHYNEAIYLIEEVALSGKTIIGFDLCEVAPDKSKNQWDENVAMRVLYKLCGAALHKKK